MQAGPKRRSTAGQGCRGSCAGFIRSSAFRAALCIGALSLTGPPTASAAPADGVAAFEPCAACHTVDGTAGAGTGPTLKDVFGRMSGSVPGFRYSRAMKNAAIVWDEASLDQFLADPQGFAPGNVMPFSGLSDRSQRAELIVYLKSQSVTGPPPGAVPPDR
jgi:cytochrome c